MTIWSKDRGISTEVRQTRRFFPPLTTLTLPSSLVLMTTAVEECFLNQYPSKTVLPARRPREITANRNINIHVPKYAADPPGVQESEKIGSTSDVWNTWLSIWAVLWIGIKYHHLSHAHGACVHGRAVSHVHVGTTMVNHRDTREQWR
jgi:hypothetical protein